MAQKSAGAKRWNQACQGAAASRLQKAEEAEASVLQFLVTKTRGKPDVEHCASSSATLCRRTEPGLSISFCSPPPPPLWLHSNMVGRI